MLTNAALTGTELIAAERERQVSVAGWAADHDDEHLSGELAVQAARLAVHHTDALVSHPDDVSGALFPGWKLAEKYDGEVRRLTVAGALIAAEIDRLLRKER